MKKTDPLNFAPTYHIDSIHSFLHTLENGVAIESLLRALELETWRTSIQEKIYFTLQAYGKNDLSGREFHYVFRSTDRKKLSIAKLFSRGFREIMCYVQNRKKVNGSVFHNDTLK